MTGFQPPRWLRSDDGLRIGAEIAAGRAPFHLVDPVTHRLRCSFWCLQEGDSPTEGDLHDLCPACVALARWPDMAPR